MIIYFHMYIMTPWSTSCFSTPWPTSIGQWPSDVTSKVPAAFSPSDWMESCMVRTPRSSLPLQTSTARPVPYAYGAAGTSTQEPIKHEKPHRRPVKAHPLQTSLRWDPITLRPSRSIKRWGARRRGGEEAGQTSRVLKLIAAAFVVKCFNLKIWPEQKATFFLSSSSPSSFQMNGLPSFCRCLAGGVWVEGGGVRPCVCMLRGFDYTWDARPHQRNSAIGHFAVPTTKFLWVLFVQLVFIARTFIVMTMQWVFTKCNFYPQTTAK